MTPQPADRYQWAEPGAYPIAPGVWRIPTVLPSDALRAVNIYALVDDDAITLIDGGWALEASRQALIDGLKEIGATLGDVRRFLVTHAHRDHYTNAIAIRREYGTPILLGAGERPTIEVLVDPLGKSLQSNFDMLARHGGQPVIDALEALGVRPTTRDRGYEPPDAWIADGARFQVGDRVLEATHTPGHTRGHVVFADRAAGVLFAGDHVLPHITPSIAFEVDPSPMALRDYLGSLAAVRSMPDMELLPAHGPAGGRTHARIDELLAHHDRRLADMAGQLTGDAMTSYQVACQTPWTSRRRVFDTLDPLNQLLAVSETALHLELLVAQGRAKVVEAEGLRGYVAAPAPGGAVMGEGVMSGGVMSGGVMGDGGVSGGIDDDVVSRCPVCGKRVYAPVGTITPPHQREIDEPVDDPGDAEPSGECPGSGQPSH